MRVAYAIDQDNVICDATGDWDRFAHDNAGAQVVSTRVIGTDLMSHISCAATREIWDSLIEGCRAQQRTLRVDFRCDSPACRRFMQLTVSAAAQGRVEFVSELVRSEAADLRLLDAGQPRSGRTLTVCSWCRQVLMPDGAWIGCEEAVNRLLVFADALLPPLSHGICPSCKERLMRQYRESA